MSRPTRLSPPLVPAQAGIQPPLFVLGPRFRGDERVFTAAKPKLAVYTHLVLPANAQIPPPTLDEMIAETRQTSDGPLLIGEDLRASR